MERGASSLAMKYYGGEGKLGKKKLLKTFATFYRAIIELKT